MKKVIENSDLHFEHELWLKELMFWKDEMKSFRNRLEEIQGRWTDETVLGELEQFQNQFFIHREKIDQLQDEIEGHEHIIALDLNNDKDVMDLKGYTHHLQVRDRIDTERMLYQDLKKRFFGFLSRFM